MNVFKLIQHIEAAMTAQLKRTSRTALGSDTSNGVSVFKVKGNIFREIDGNMYFTVIQILKFKHSSYLPITTHVLWFVL